MAKAEGDFGTEESAVRIVAQRPLDAHGIAEVDA